jgi:cytochrome c biogenesis protein CcmG/thiol:disulfide interchange protein DsbE
MKSKWLIMAIPLVLFVGMAVFLAVGLQKDPSLLPSVKVDKPLPAFSLSSLENPERLLAQTDIKGPALLNVWGTWCPSCQIEHPLLVELAKGGIRLYGLNYKDDRAVATQYLQKMGNPYVDVIFDEKGSLGFDLGVYGAPETFLIDAQGLIRYRHVGEISADQWRNVLWPKWQALAGTVPAASATTEAVTGAAQ